MMLASLPLVPRGGRGRGGRSVVFFVFLGMVADVPVVMQPVFQQFSEFLLPQFQFLVRVLDILLCHRDGYAVQSLGWLLRARCCATTGAMVVVVRVLFVFPQCLVRPCVHVLRQSTEAFWTISPLFSESGFRPCGLQRSLVCVCVQRQVPVVPMPRSSSTTVVWLVLLVTMHLALCWHFTLYSTRLSADPRSSASWPIWTGSFAPARGVTTNAVLGQGYDVFFA